MELVGYDTSEKLILTSYKGKKITNKTSKQGTTKKTR